MRRTIVYRNAVDWGRIVEGASDFERRLLDVALCVCPPELSG